MGLVELSVALDLGVIGVVGGEGVPVLDGREWLEVKYSLKIAIE